MKTFLILATFVLYILTVTAFGSDGCPEVLRAPKGLMVPDKVFEFALDDTDLPNNLQYKWSVSGGTIISGQNERSMKFSPGRDLRGVNVKVSVEIIGLGEKCVISDIAPVATDPIGEPFDEFGALSKNDFRSKLDSAFSRFKDNRSSGFILIHIIFNETDSRKYKRSLLNIVSQQVKLRNFDAAKIKIALESSSNEQTRIWFVPDGAETKALFIDTEKVNLLTLREVKKF